VLNPSPAPGSGSERYVCERLRSVGIACDYEPMLLQLIHPMTGSQLGFAPDLWLPERGLLVEMGSPVAKTPLLRAAGRAFSHLAFGLVTEQDALDLRSMDDAGVWLDTCLARNALIMDQMQAEDAGIAARDSALRSGASAQGALRAQRGATRRWMRTACPVG
jgi:hypothetical protein